MALIHQPPKGLLRLLLRLPVPLYRAGLGWLLGSRTLMLTHVGRKSGKVRRTVLEVVRRDRESDSFVICSGWGTGSQWFRNVRPNPDVRVTFGARTRAMRATVLPVDAAESEFRSYASRHPGNLKILARLMLGRSFSGSDADFAELARTLLVLSLR